MLLRLEIMQETEKEVVKYIHEEPVDKKFPDKEIIIWLSCYFQSFFNIRYAQGKPVKFKPEVKIVVSFNEDIRTFGVKRLTKDAIKNVVPFPLISHKSQYFLFRKVNLIYSNSRSKPISVKPIIENRLEIFFNTIEYQQTFEFRNFSIDKPNPFRN